MAVLLKLDPIIQTGMRDGFLSMGHGRALVNMENRKDQIALYEKIIGQNLSVRDTENAVKNYHNSDTPKPSKSKVETPTYVKSGIDEISKHLSAGIKVKTSGKSKGSITIPFNSKEEFERIKKLITGA